MCCGDTSCAGCSGRARAGTFYVTTDVPFMTNFTNVCTSVYVCPGRVGAVWKSGPDQNGGILACASVIHTQLGHMNQLEPSMLALHGTAQSKQANGHTPPGFSQRASPEL